MCATLHKSFLCTPQKPLLARILPPPQTNSSLQHHRHCVHTCAAAAVQAAPPPYQEYVATQCAHTELFLILRALLAIHLPRFLQAKPSHGPCSTRVLAPYRLTSCWVWREAHTSGCTGKSSTSSVGRPAPWSLVLHRHYQVLHLAWHSLAQAPHRMPSLTVRQPLKKQHRSRALLRSSHSAQGAKVGHTQRALWVLVATAY